MEVAHKIQDEQRQYVYYVVREYRLYGGTDYNDRFLSALRRARPVGLQNPG